MSLATKIECSTVTLSKSDLAVFRLPLLNALNSIIRRKFSSPKNFSMGAV